MSLLQQFGLPRERREIEGVACLLANVVDLVEQRPDRLRDRNLWLGRNVGGCGHLRPGPQVCTGNGARLLVVHDTTTLAQVTDTECADVCSNVCIVAGNGHIGGVDRLRVDVVAIE